MKGCLMMVNHSFKTNRYISLDLARGMMLLFVALAHASLYAGSTLLYRPESMSSLDTIFKYVSIFFVDNRARAMFAFLFGYGLTLIVSSYLKRNQTLREAKMSLYRRALYLLIFGFILSVFIGGQDILAIYGAALLCITWLLFKSDKILKRSIVMTSAMFLMVLPVLWSGMAVMLQSGVDLQITYTSYSENLSSKLIQFVTGGPFLANFALPIVISILLGVWVGRKKRLNEKPEHKSYLQKVAFIGLSISILGAIPQALYNGGVIETSPIFTGFIFSLHMVTGIIGGVSYAAIFGLLGPKLAHKEKLIRPITALGKRSLTFFIVNETLLVVFLSTYVLNLGESLGISFSWLIACGVWILALLLASILEKKQMSGPLDQLFRKLVHRKTRAEKEKMA